MVFEGFREVDDLRPFRVDGQSGDDQIRLRVKQLAHETVPTVFVVVVTTNTYSAIPVGYVCGRENKRHNYEPKGAGRE